MNNNPIPQEFLDFIHPIDFQSMWDLGNKKTGKVLYKTYWESLGIKYDSIDLNGLDRAIKVDLQKPLSFPKRDMVMNLGTSEHILKQEPVFRNIHNLSNDRMIHMVPDAGKRKKHGYWGYYIMFFLILADINKYALLRQIQYEPKRKIWMVSFRKSNNDEFVWGNILNKYLYHNKHGIGGVTYGKKKY